MNVVSTNWIYSLALVDMIGTLNDLGTFAMEAIEGIGAQRTQPLCFNLSKCMVTLIEGIEAEFFGPQYPQQFPLQKFQDC